MQKYIPVGFGLTLGSLFLLIGLNTYGNPETTYKFINFDVNKLILPFLVIEMALRIKYGSLLRKKLLLLLEAVTAILILMVAGLSIFWFQSYENSVFELTRLNLQGLTLLLVISGMTALINQSKQWWQKNWQKVICLGPFVAYFIFYLVSLWHFNIFKEVVKEDHIVELLQFWVLFAGGVIALINTWFFAKKKKWFNAIFWLIMMMGMFVVAGDEISWGQRLFGLSVSESVMEFNRQGEITVHNLYAIEWLVIYAYVVVSFFGIASHWIAAAIKPLRRYQDWLPPAILFGYFLVPFVFFVQQLRVEWGIWHSWSEVAELFLYSGITLWLALIRPSKFR